jgi:hypothetical protein
MVPTKGLRDDARLMSASPTKFARLREDRARATFLSIREAWPIPRDYSPPTIIAFSGTSAERSAVPRRHAI